MVLLNDLCRHLHPKCLFLLALQDIPQGWSPLGAVWCFPCPEWHLEESFGCSRDNLGSCGSIDCSCWECLSLFEMLWNLRVMAHRLSASSFPPNQACEESQHPPLCLFFSSFQFRTVVGLSQNAKHWRLPSVFYALKLNSEMAFAKLFNTRSGEKDAVFLSRLGMCIYTHSKYIRGATSDSNSTHS